MAKSEIKEAREKRRRGADEREKEKRKAAFPHVQLVAQGA